MSWLGGISLVQPLSAWMLTAFACAAAAAVVALVTWGQYTRHSTVSGQLIPDLGLSTVMASTHGVVARVFPEEGERVQAGDKLMVIDVPRATKDGGDALRVIREGIDARQTSLRKLLESKKAQLDIQRDGYQRQRDAAARQLVQIEHEIATRQQQVAIATDTFERVRTLTAKESAAQLQLNREHQALLDLVHEQQALERQASEIRRTLAQLDQSRRELPSQRDELEASTQRDLALLSQERVERETSGELLVKAPVAGLLASRLIEPGQAVQQGQPLLSVLPEGSKLQAQLLVPSKAIGFIEPGDRVLLRYQAFPYQKFGHHEGRVIRISHSAIAPGTAPTAGTGASAAEPHYRVLVELNSQTIQAYGVAQALRPGMVLEADVLSERRRLYEWLLEPLYALTGKYAQR